MIIGLSGYARSGKDTAADGLAMWGFKRIAFADTLREFLLMLNPIVGSRSCFGYKDSEKVELPGIGYVRLSDVIDAYGWDGYKETSYGPETRKLMQRLGTECGRELIYEDVWVDATLDDYRTGKSKSIVVSDTRFPNEAAAIKEFGGIVVRINRPGVGPANDHQSETALDDWTFDSVIDNDGTVDQLVTRVANAALFHVL